MNFSGNRWLLASIPAAILSLTLAGCTTKAAVKEEPAPEAPKQEVKEPEKPLAFETVYFEYNMSDLRSEARSALKRDADLLLAKPEAKINVDGHCDERGTDEYNVDLGWKRAYAVRDYLKKMGVGEKQMYPASYGRARPAVIGNDESAFSKNRRVEMSVKP